MLRSILGALLVASLGLLLLPGVGEVWLVLLLVGAIAFGVTKAGGAVEGIRRLDELFFFGERLIVATSLVVMAVVVFIDVVWRTAHSVEGSMVYGFPLGILGLCLLGGYTARWKVSAAKRIGAGFAAYVVLAVLCVLIYLAPNGFGWSQRLALVLILWVGMLGGSMATREGRHIAVDAVKRVIPPHLSRGFEIAGGLVTVILGVVLTILGTTYARANYVDWTLSGGRSFIFESLPIPYWAATIPIPIGFGLMAARFLGVTIFGAKEVDLLTSVGAGPSERSEDEEPAT